jgi:hypothetical protein
MSDLLYRALLDRETELVNEIHRQLKHSTSQHYMDMDWEVLLRRVESMVAYFLMSVRESPDLFIKYINEAVEERIDEGFRLAEILMALRILEEKVWLVCVEDVPLPGRTSALARVTGTIGAAKDRLAVVYVERAEREEADALVTEPGTDVRPSQPRKRPTPPVDGVING